MRLQFNLKTMLLVVFVICACVGICATYLQSVIPVTRLDCTVPWRDVVNGGDVVIFVDCKANGYTQIYADQFNPFCKWYRGRYGRNPVLLDTLAGTGESWDVLQSTWVDHDVLTGGYKSFGGAGHVVWVKDGEVVGVGRLSDNDVESLKRQTEEYFADDGPRVRVRGSDMRND